MGNFYNLAIALAIPALSLTAAAAPVHPAIPAADFHKRLEYKAVGSRGLLCDTRTTQINTLNTRMYNDHKSLRSAANTGPDASFPASMGLDVMDTPDGSLWYYTYNLDYEEVDRGGYTENVITGYSVDIYDAGLKHYGTVSGKTALSDGETRIADVQVSPLLSKKFFNIDDKYELMVTVVCNTSVYVNNYHTYVYSINGEKDEEGNDKAVFEKDDFLFSGYLNASPDPWGETMYFVFAKDCQEFEEGVDPENASFQDYINSYKVKYEIYSKAGWSGGPSKILDLSLRNEQLPGDQQNMPAIMMVYEDKVPYLLFQKYENNFHNDQTSPMDDNYSQAESNNLVVQLYKLSASGATLSQETKIPVAQDKIDDVYFSYYGVGGLGYTSDINFHDYGTPAGKAAFIVTKWNYKISDDDNYDNYYYVYDDQGNRKTTLFEKAFGFTSMGDIDGFDPQYLFVEQNGDVYTFHFVNMLTGEDECAFDSQINYNGDVENILASLDRTPAGDSYMFVAEMKTPGLDAEGNDLMRFAWITPEGKIDHIDSVNMGKDVRMAQSYINSQVLNPYVFDTDGQYEYMLLAKRGSESSSSITEELIIAKPISEESPSGETVLHLVPNAEKGALRTIMPLLTQTSNRLLVTWANSMNSYTADFYNLPINRFAGGDGTAENPWQIASVGDLREMRDNLAAHYVIVSDFDAAGYPFESIATASKPFTGTLDGQNHTVSNLEVYSSDGGAIFAAVSNATVKNINFFNAKVDVTEERNNALVARMANGSTFENIHVLGLEMNADANADALVGGLLGQITSGTAVRDCSVSNGHISIPGSSDFYGVGGIVGETRTGSSIVSSAFIGSITGGQAVGGILGTADKDAKIVNCHVDADIKAKNTVGGVIGTSNRAQVRNCYVEGTIEATEKSRRSGYNAGGIVGYLSQYFGAGEEGAAAKAATSVPVIISGNVVGIESITVPENAASAPENTVHRIVGYTSANATNIDWDNTVDEDNPVYLPAEEEKGLSDNHAVATLVKIDADGEALHSSVEGADVEASDLTGEFFTGLGFAFGETSDSPWNEVPENDPSLHHEIGARFVEADITVEEESDFTADLIIVSRKALDPEEVGGDFTCDSSDEEVACMNGEMALDGNRLTLGFTAGKTGNAEITAGVGASEAKFTVKVIKKTNAIEGIAEVTEGSRILYNGGYLICEGSFIEVFNIDGAKIAEGLNSVKVADLAAGVYAAIATDDSGRKSSVKILVK